VEASVTELAKAADRFDALAEIAELMDDDDGAARFRERAAHCRAEAMRLLDRLG
jgi:hypothetical protein